MFKSLFLILISFTILFADSIATDNYYVLLEKKRVEALNNSVKFSLNSSNNDFTWGNNNLNIRNSRFLNTLEQRDLNYRDKEILIHLEQNITKDLISNNSDINCENIVTNIYNTISITRSECINIEMKIKNYYESSFYNISIPQDGRLNKADYTYKNLYRITFKDRNDKSKVFKNLKKLVIVNREILNGIKYMDIDTLRSTCDKLDDETTILSKTLIANEVVTKAYNLGTPADDIRVKCSTYDFDLKKEAIDAQPALTLALSKNLHDFLDELVVDINVQIGNVDTNLGTKQTEINNHISYMNSISCPLPPATPTGFRCIGAQNFYNTLQSDLSALQNQKTELENSRDAYLDIKSTTTNLTTVVGISNYLKIRAIENHLFDFINGINRINFYINKYILSYGSAPSKNDLKVKYNDQIDDVSWPKSYDGASDITFNVDLTNFKVTYSTLNIPADNPFSNFDERDLFSRHLSLKQNSIIDADDLILPMNNETIKFISKFNSRPIGTLLGLRSDNTCSIVSDTVTLYEPNGSGFFDVYYCDWGGSAAWLPIATFEDSKSEVRLEDKIYLSGKKLYSVDGLIMKKNIIIDGNGTLRRIKR